MSRKRKKRHLGSHSNGNKDNRNQYGQNWINLATEMNDNDTAQYLSGNNPGKLNILLFIRVVIAIYCKLLN